MAISTPPQAPPFLAYSPESLIHRTEQLIAGNKKLTDGVVQNISVEAAEFSNVLFPLVRGRSMMSLEMNVIGFLRSVSADPNIRAASASAEKKLSDYDIESSMREDVFALVEAVYNKQKDDITLDAESRFLLAKEYKAYLRMGLGLLPPQRERFQQIKKRLPQLYIANSKNLSEEKGGIWLKPEELTGVPNDVIETLEKGKLGGENDGKLKLTFKIPDLRPVQKHCAVAETRKKL